MTMNNELIYIPLWLDLLYSLKTCGIAMRVYLHSTMVRFIINAFESDI